MRNFIESVLNQFADNITDNVFLMIQNDPVLMREYLNLLNSSNQNHVDLNTLNSNIGREIKIRFSLDNTGICDNPSSTLIQTYERHKII